MTDQTIARADAVSLDASGLFRHAEAVLHYSLGAVVALTALAGWLRLTDAGIPGCGAARVDRTLTAILRANGPEGAAAAARREISRTASEARCAATLSAADGTRYDMAYRIFRTEAGRLRVAASWQAR